jgi:hypothetical protein
METNAAVYHLLQDPIFETGVFLLHVACLFEQMFVSSYLGLIHHIFAVIYCLPSRVDKDQNLFASLEMSHDDLVAFLVIYLTDVTLARKVVGVVLRVLDPHKVDDQRDRSETGVKMEHACLPGHP